MNRFNISSPATNDVLRSILAGGLILAAVRDLSGISSPHSVEDR